VGICGKLMVCFICATLGHYMNDCPNWKKKLPVADYIGSASALVLVVTTFRCLIWRQQSG
jgi:predicted membrane channel-forming protein YqfA (hemolysin III family)